jgi:hypothetical protein
MKLSANTMSLQITLLYKYYVSEQYPSCFYLKHNVSETGLCPSFQVEPTQLGPVDRDIPHLRTPAPTQDGVYKPSTAQTISES